MSLWLQAAADVRAIVEDQAGFSRPVSVTNPQGVTAQLSGIAKDISATIDPQTGVLVSSRSAAVTFSMASLTEAGLGIPKNIPDKTSRPWVVQFFDPSGALHVFKVSESLPDQTLGVIVCKLESYKLSP